MNFTKSSNSTDAGIIETGCGNTTSREDSTLDQLQTVASYLWIVISPALFVIGFFGNISIVAILTKLEFWKKPTYVLLIILAMSDTTVLCVGLSRYWIREVFQVDIRSLSNVGCKINVFVIYVSMQFSSAILVCVTFERFLKTRFPLRYNIIVSLKKTVFLIIFCFLLLTALNVFWFVTNGLVEEDGDFSCDAVSDGYFWFEEFVYTYIDLSVLSVIPFVTMVAMNISIYKVLLESKNLRNASVSDETTRKELGKFSRVLTRMLLFTSTYFLITTVPISVYFITDSYVVPDADNLTVAKMDVAWAVTYLFQFSNYAVNFFLYMSTNKAFQRAFYEVWCCSTSVKMTRRGSRAVSTTQLSRMTSVSEDDETKRGKISKNTEMGELGHI